MTRDQAKSFLEENQVKFVLAQFVDIHGVAKTKSVPVGHFEDILNDGAGFAGFAVWGLGQEPHGIDHFGQSLRQVERPPSGAGGSSRVDC